MVSPPWPRAPPPSTALPAPREISDATTNHLCQPIPLVDIAPAVRGTVGAAVRFELARTLPALETDFGPVSRAWPATLLATQTMYTYASFTNPTALTAKVSLWGQVPAGAPTSRTRSWPSILGPPSPPIARSAWEE